MDDKTDRRDLRYNGRVVADADRPWFYRLPAWITELADDLAPGLAIAIPMLVILNAIR